MFSAYLRITLAYLLLATFVVPCVSAQQSDAAIPARLSIPDGTAVEASTLRKTFRPLTPVWENACLL